MNNKKTIEKVILTVIIISLILLIGLGVYFIQFLVKSIESASYYKGPAEITTHFDISGAESLILKEE